MRRSGRDAGGDRDYFNGIAAALRRARLHQPTLVIDLARFDANIDRVAKRGEGRTLRVVAKSLPCQTLLDRILGHERFSGLMTFSLAMLKELQRVFPAQTQLLGKPMPAAGVAAFLDDGGTGEGVIWLADTSGRLREYDEIAASRGLVLDVALELNIGLERGGFRPGADLQDALRFLSEAKAIRIGGVMGYDAHLAKAPPFLGLAARAIRRSAEALEAAVTQIRAAAPESEATLMVNRGGSLTLDRYADSDVSTELSVASALVKPLDFDHPSTVDLSPALYIATPVLKVATPGRVPIIDFASPVIFRGRSALHIFGGNWLAKPVFPANLVNSSLVGRSSNHELLIAPSKTGAKVDDYVFFRPTQCEAVMLQFGPIAIVSGGDVVEFWSPLESR